MSPQEQERRRHIRQWTRFMITHLERTEPEDVRHYSYIEALERLRELIDQELARVKEQDRLVPQSTTSSI